MTQNDKFEDLWTELFTRDFPFKGNRIPMVGEQVQLHANGQLVKGELTHRAIMESPLHGCQALAGVDTGEDQYIIDATSLVVNDVILLSLDESFIHTEEHKHLEFQDSKGDVTWIDFFEAKDDAASEMVGMAADLAKYHLESGGKEDLYFVSVNICGTNLIACGGIVKGESFIPTKPSLRLSSKVKEGAD